MGTEKHASKRLAGALGPQSDYTFDRASKKGPSGRRARRLLKAVVTRVQRRQDKTGWKRDQTS